MLAGVSVLAANSGGPLETVSDPETGWLRSVEKVEEWTDVMKQVLFNLSSAHLQQMGVNGKARVETEFSSDKMSHRFDDEISEMLKARRVEATELGDVAVGIPVILLCILAIGGVIKAGINTEELHSLEIGLGTLLITVASCGIGGIVYKLMQNESAFM